MSREKPVEPAWKGNLKPWPKGRSANPGGRPSERTKLTRAIEKKASDVVALAKSLTTGSDEWIESARRRILAGKAPQLELLLLSYAHGKPKEAPSSEEERRAALQEQGAFVQLLGAAELASM